MRPHGGHFTIVEKDKGLINRGIEIGYIQPPIDTVVHKDVVQHLQEQATQVDLITFFGVGEWYFKRGPRSFSEAAGACLREGGVLLLTGVKTTHAMFHEFQAEYGGTVFKAGSHVWDAYGYVVQK